MRMFVPKHVLLIAIVSIVALSLPSDAQALTVPRIAGYATTTVSVPWGGTVRDAVRVYPGGSGTLQVQARKRGTTSWRVLTKTPIASDGTARASMTPPSTGTWEFRVVSTATASRPRIASAVRLIRATSPAITRVSWTTGVFSADRGTGTALGFQVTTGTGARPRLVSLMRQRPGETGWSSVGTTTTDQAGRGSFTYSSKEIGTVSLRLLAEETSSAQLAWSPPRSFQVMPAVIEGPVGQVDLLSNPAEGAWSNVVFSADSSVVGYIAGGGPTSVPQAYVWNRKTDVHTLLTAKPDGTVAPYPVLIGSKPMGATDVAVSADGTKAAFTTDSYDIVPGDTHFRYQVYVRDLTTGQVTVVTRDLTGDLVGGEQPAFSSDGRHLAFSSGAPGIVADDTDDRWDVFEADLVTGSVRLVSRSVAGASSDGGSYDSFYSPVGGLLAFRSDDSTLVADDPHNQMTDVFVDDGSTLRLVSSSSDPDDVRAGSDCCTETAFSPDGTRIAYSGAVRKDGALDPSLQAVVVTLPTGSVTVASTLDDGTLLDGGSGGRLSWSRDGRFLAFSKGTLGGPTMAMVKDTQSGALTRALRSPSGTAGDGEDASFGFAASADTLLVVSTSQNLGSTTQQAYTGTLLDGMSIATKSADGTPGDSSTWDAWLSPDGRALIASSSSGSLIGDNDHTTRTFLIQLA